MISTPRYLRPHEIVIKNYIGEIDDVANYIDTTIKYVRVDENFGITQTQKGVDSDDTMQIVIDMNDLMAIQDNSRAKYLSKDQYMQEKGTFTLRGDKDFISYNGMEYTVNKVKTHILFSNIPEYIEVTVK